VYLFGHSACHESWYSNLAYIEGNVPVLGLDHFVHAHILHEELDYSISMLYGRKAVRLICWERHATTSQGRFTLVGELIWRQHSRPRLHHRLTHGSPSGTLGMGVATQVTMRVVVITPLTVTLSLASEQEHPPLPGILTGVLLWSGTLVMGLTRQSARWKGSDDSSDEWMTLHMCKRRCKPLSTHRPA
jgi:hypothetical protein